ncbi:hypothetical protein MLD38_020891 [Melastoma candidum]|uniref:Uncharacterized protein n=1 Tax=Melastoma candidum TaxID=119954 RepID=A0ACB9QEH3_9MYRT|nr:hypothetical protein MLD38_020891 [Melastoma candidum]
MYYTLLVVSAIVCGLSTRPCSARPFGADIVPGDQLFENKPSPAQKLELLSNHAGSTTTLPRSQVKDIKRFKPMTISEDNRQSLMAEKTRLNDRPALDSTHGDSEENIEPKEAESVRNDVEVMDYAQPRRKPPIHNQEP